MKLIIATAITMLATSAAAQQVCGSRDKIVESLERKYHEQQIAFGVTGSGSVAEVFKSNEGTWTLIHSYPSGTSCLVASGEAWQNIKEDKGKGY